MLYVCLCVWRLFACFMAEPTGVMASSYSTLLCEYKSQYANMTIHKQTM